LAKVLYQISPADCQQPWLILTFGGYIVNKIVKIEIDFPAPVEFPEGWERVLDELVYMICKQYEKDNTDRVMWPAGHGSKPLWDEPNEPEFDDSIYHIDVAEREDLYGRNDHNPNKEELQEKRRKAKELGKKRSK